MLGHKVQDIDDPTPDTHNLIPSRRYFVRGGIRWNKLLEKQPLNAIKRRNAQITYNKEFFRRQWFASYGMLKRQSKNFQRFHNRHHRYSCLNGKTPMEVIEKADFKPIKLGGNTKLPVLDTIPDGNIILIRFIRSDRILDIFGEKFKVSKSLVYSYVKAVIVTKIHRLQLYLGEELVDTFDYTLTSDLIA